MSLTPDEVTRIEAQGFRVTNVTELFGLTPEDELIIEMRLALSDLVKTRREKLGVSQTAVAKRIGTGQARVSKIESNDPSASFDMLIKAAAATGATVADVAAALMAQQAQTDEAHAPASH